VAFFDNLPYLWGVFALYFWLWLLDGYVVSFRAFIGGVVFYNGDGRLFV
jgi:hypothetical protein